MDKELAAKVAKLEQQHSSKQKQQEQESQYVKQNFDNAMHALHQQHQNIEQREIRIADNTDKQVQYDKRMFCLTVFIAVVSTLSLVATIVSLFVILYFQH